MTPGGGSAPDETTAPVEAVASDNAGGTPAAAPAVPGVEPTRRPVQTLFLERETYRRRRVMDAARLLPVFGAALLLVPVFWGQSHGTGSGGIYLFLVWLGIIVVTGVLAQRLSAPLRRNAKPGSGSGTAPVAGASSAPPNPQSGAD